MYSCYGGCHLAALHSFTHEYSTVYANETDFMDEVQRTYELICENSPNGEQPFKLFRFPGGGFNDANYGPEKQQYKEALANAGFYYCDWNALNGDAEGGAKNADELLEYFNTYRPEGKNLIILMHDSETKQETANMLASMIEELLNEGYTFHRLDEIDFTNTSNVSGTSSSASAITGETSGSLSDTSDTSSDTSYDDSDESYSDDTVSSDDSSNSSSSQSSSSSTGTASHSSSVNSTGTQGSATSSGSSSSSKSSSSTSTYSSSESDGNSSVNVYSGSSQHSSSDSDESDTDDSSSNSAYTNDDESSNHDTSSNDESNNSSSNNTLEAE